MKFKFASLPGEGNQKNALNDVVQQLGSVESLFESPERIAGLMARAEAAGFHTDMNDNDDTTCL